MTRRAPPEGKLSGFKDAAGNFLKPRSLEKAEAHVKALKKEVKMF
jgi:hypothetical protein